MQPLDKTLRNRLERTIKDARDIAEDAARAALEQLGVGEAAPFAHLSEQDRELRRKLRVHGRQLGDSLNGGKIQTMDRLIEEVAYEHWHRMLFARFLAENNLLMYPDPDDPVAVTLEECEDLAADEGAANGWELAARFAADLRMNHNNFGLLVDLSHFPQTYETSRFVLQTLRPYITHLHVGSAVMKRGAEAFGDTHPRFGFPNGANDVPEMLDFLRVCKEEGFFRAENPMVLSFEVKPWKDEDPDVVTANAKRVLNRAWAMLED